MKETKVIKNLDLSSSRITDIGENDCSPLSYSMESINLSYNKLNKIEEMSCLLQNFPTIVTLDLSHNLFERFATDWKFMNTSLEYLVSKIIVYIIEKVRTSFGTNVNLGTSFWRSPSNIVKSLFFHISNLCL